MYNKKSGFKNRFGIAKHFVFVHNKARDLGIAPQPQVVHDSPLERLIQLLVNHGDTVVQRLLGAGEIDLAPLPFPGQGFSFSALSLVGDGLDVEQIIAVLIDLLLVGEVARHKVAGFHFLQLRRHTLALVAGHVAPGVELTAGRGLRTHRSDCLSQRISRAAPFEGGSNGDFPGLPFFFIQRKCYAFSAPVGRYGAISRTGGGISAQGHRVGEN